MKPLVPLLVFAVVGHALAETIATDVVVYGGTAAGVSAACTSVRWTPEIPEAGDYQIVLHFPPNPNRATNVPVTVEADGQAAKTVSVNERTKTGAVVLGEFTLKAGKSVTVTLSNTDTDGFVVVDGLQLLKGN